MIQCSLTKEAQQPQEQPTGLEVTRAELAAERAARLRAEARVAEAEDRARSAEARLALAEQLVSLLRSELTDGEEHHWWQFWVRRPELYTWKDARDSSRRETKAATQSPAGDPLGYQQQR